MEEFEHNLENLFKQLGFFSDKEIKVFFKKGAPIPPGTRLEDADFWSSSQSEFLGKVSSEDSSWSEAVDQLNLRLR